MKVKAAVAWGPGRPLSIETVDLEGPKKGEVLVKIIASGVCHTDAYTCLLYTSPSPRDGLLSRMPSSA